MKTILVTEDDLAILRGLTENLKRAGYRVLAEKDGMRGYERAKLEHPDLVILDVMLPTMDGFQICSALKKEGFLSPIFLLTGLTQERSRLEGLSQGADDYIAKPFNLQELLLRIRNALKQRDAVRARGKSLEDEFLKARKIQMASLPRIQPKMRGLEVFGKTVPATQVGGDYFDYIDLANGKLCLLIADVSGKGMPAALYVQRMQGIVQSSAHDIQSATDVLKTLQKHMKDSLDPGSFVTAAALMIDTRAQTLEVAQAGHLPVLQARNRKIAELKPEGVWIGRSSAAMFETSLAEKTIETRDGDIFLLYTDGLVEAKNRKGEEFGMERLKDVVADRHLNARSLVERCFKEVRKFSGSQGQLDDMTIVALKVVGTHPKKKERTTP